jgi:hypothetical protein
MVEFTSLTGIYALAMAQRSDPITFYQFLLLIKGHAIEKDAVKHMRSLRLITADGMHVETWAVAALEAAGVKFWRWHNEIVDCDGGYFCRLRAAKVEDNAPG